MYEFSDNSYSSPDREAINPELLSEVRIPADYDDGYDFRDEELSPDTSAIGIDDGYEDNRDVLNVEPVNDETTARDGVSSPEPVPETTDTNGAETGPSELPILAPTEENPEFPNIRLAGESDVADRLPEFEEIRVAVKDLVSQGALEGVSEEVKYYLDRMVPVGVNEQGEVVRPEGYRPEEMLPVLVVKPGEAVNEYKLPGLTEEAETAERMIKSTGTLVSMTPQVLDRPVGGNLSTSNPAHTRYSELLIAPRDAPDKPYPVYLPRLMVISSAILAEDKKLVLAHEADHWDFFIRIAPTLGNENGERYSGAQLQTLAEKCAYETQYAVAEKLGHYDSVESVEELAEPFKIADIPPEYADYAAAMPRSLQRHLLFSNVPEVSRMPFIVKAITYTYGRPDKLITDEEVIAFRNIGILAKGF